MLKVLSRNFLSKNLSLLPSHNFSVISALREKFSEPKEIQIPVPWGHIAGKWWGDSDVRPFLALHGWQDNANSWDPIAPLLLPTMKSILTIDLLGHGSSSHFPEGEFYNLTEYVVSVQRICNHYKWETVSLLTHSLGSLIGFTYSGFFPNRVDYLIAIDALKPIAAVPDIVASHYRAAGFKLLEDEKRDSKQIPLYSYEEAVERFSKSFLSDMPVELCKVLLRRGLKEVEPGRYSFRRDNRIKIRRLEPMTHCDMMELASNINCNFLFLKANPGYTFDNEAHFQAVIDVLRKTTKRFQYSTVDGVHHVHMTQPKEVADVINKFIDQG